MRAGVASEWRVLSPSITNAVKIIKLIADTIHSAEYIIKHIQILTNQLNWIDQLFYQLFDNIFNFNCYLQHFVLNVWRCILLIFLLHPRCYPRIVLCTKHHQLREVGVFFTVRILFPVTSKGQTLSGGEINVSMLLAFILLLKYIKNNYIKVCPIRGRRGQVALNGEWKYLIIRNNLR